jgi:hypothetical protein
MVSFFFSNLTVGFPTACIFIYFVVLKQNRICIDKLEISSKRSKETQKAIQEGQTNVL